MQSTLRKPLAAALLLSSAAALLAQPAFARDGQYWGQAPAVVAPAPAPANPNVRDRDDDRFDHDRGGWRGERGNFFQRHRDDFAPVITDVTPLPGERVGERWRMTVSARFNDSGSGVNPATVQLRIDGRDVTGDSRVEEDEVRFHNNLFPGRHFAEVIVRDWAGNIARRSWQFDVVDAGRRGYRDDGGYGRWGWQR